MKERQREKTKGKKEAERQRPTERTDNEDVVGYQ